MTKDILEYYDDDGNYIIDFLATGQKIKLNKKLFELYNMKSIKITLPQVDETLDPDPESCIFKTEFIQFKGPIRPVDD
jgi:hypothetical protein